MIKIDRMEIDDAGTDPRKLAKSILKQLPRDIVKIPVRDIAQAIDIYEIREAKLSGLEGALIVPLDKSEGAILVNEDRHETRKRYTIAHEIGHYVHPLHRGNAHEGFFCKSKDMTVEGGSLPDLHTRIEAQANEFAAELLMPSVMIADFVRAAGPTDLQHILDLAERHEVSREAAARRYIPKAIEPAAIVFSHEGVVRYVRQNEFFPRLSIFRGQQVPRKSVSFLSAAEIGEVSDAREVDTQLWLAQSDPKKTVLFEQTLAQLNGYRMTLLTVEMEKDEDEWEAPHFKGQRF